jgi:ABC-type Fe3+ transport system permease subunit
MLLLQLYLLLLVTIKVCYNGPDRQTDKTDRHTQQDRYPTGHNGDVFVAAAVVHVVAVAPVAAVVVPVVVTVVVGEDKGTDRQTGKQTHSRQTDNHVTKVKYSGHVT